MKNIFTGTLAFIVYAGLCLLLFNELFTDSFKTDQTVKETEVSITPEPVVDEITVVNKDSVVNSSSDFIAELDSIEGTKRGIDQPLLDIESDSLNQIAKNDTIATIQQDTSAAIPEVEEPTIYEAKAFTIKDENGNALTQCTTFTTIYKNNPKVKIPYTCRTYGNEIKEFLSNSPKAQIHINGFYSPEEDADMGLKRAQYVKKLLTNIGIKASQISTIDALKNIPFNSGIAQGGVEISLSGLSKKTPSTASEKTVAITKTTTPQPTVTGGSGPYGYKRFTSGYQADYFYGNRTFTAYVNEISKYLNENPGKKVYVYAYTDTVGNATDNYNIAKDNVNTSKQLMMQNGIPSNRIVGVPKGEKSAGVSGSNRGMVIIVK